MPHLQSISESPYLRSPLPKSFFEEPPVRLAKKLIGTILVRETEGHLLSARIVEAEAYAGSDDPASHAYRGRTQRNEVMFRSGGYAYIYFTYGMHYCFNVVSGRKDGLAGAVLFRAAEPLDGITIMRRNRGKQDLSQLLSGPAKLCEAMDITGELNGIGLQGPPLYLTPPPDGAKIRIRATPRIGITNGKDKRWRFVDADSGYLSVRIGKTR